jgi:hsp70-interacting protein
VSEQHSAAPKPALGSDHHPETRAGLFEWSIAQQGDGTAAARPLTEQDRSWLEGALKSAMIDLSKRMQDIKATLDGGEAATAAESDAEPATLQQKEQLLGELMDIVDSIDLARGEWLCQAG